VPFSPSYPASSSLGVLIATTTTICRNNIISRQIFFRFETTINSRRVTVVPPKLALILTRLSHTYDALSLFIKNNPPSVSLILL
jgi:hypothetical protein